MRLNSTLQRANPSARRCGPREGRRLSAISPDARAYSLAPGRVYLHLRGREPRGRIAGREEYGACRAGVAADLLPRITPRRFNPEGRRWLPILHTARAGRHYTALFSNTERAHRLGTTHDWVVIYGDGAGGGRWTVVTAPSGPLQGRRVVRGREDECVRFYAVRAG